MTSTVRMRATSEDETTKGCTSWASWLGSKLARQKLAAIISRTQYNSLQDEERRRIIAKTLRLVRRYPKLANQLYQRNNHHHNYRSRTATMGDRYVQPLLFLLEMGAETSQVEEIYQLTPLDCPELIMFPQLPRDITSRPAGDLPIHLACQLGRVSDQVIILIAKTRPHHVFRHDKHGYLPLHALLRNPTRSASVAEIETLLEIHPNSIQEDCGCGTPFQLACKSSHTTNDVLELLISRYADKWDQMQLGAVVARAFGARYVERHDERITFHLHQAETFALMLPKLKTFSCLPCSWEVPAYHHLMKSLIHPQQSTPTTHQQPSLRDLSLHLPCSLLWNNEEACNAIQQLLEENTTLECLHLDFGNDNNDNGFGYAWIRNCLTKVVVGLCKNRTLRECHLSGSVMARLSMDFYRKQFFAPLLQQLLESNLTLEWISIAPLICMLPVEGEQVLYWTRLNRFGRAQARNPTLDKERMVELLVKANTWLQSTNHSFVENDPVNVLFGLLMECPSAWSTSR